MFMNISVKLEGQLIIFVQESVKSIDPSLLASAVSAPVVALASPTAVRYVL